MTVNTTAKTERDWFAVDNITCYRYVSLPYIKNPKPIINIDLLPDYKNFWAGELQPTTIPISKEFLLSNNKQDQLYIRHISLYTIIIAIIATIVFAIL
jgi:hypothetical protein